jgi:hypothetical protein
MVFRTLVLYFLLIVSVRLTGKRELGQLEPSELVVSMLEDVYRETDGLCCKEYFRAE